MTRTQPLLCYSESKAKSTLYPRGCFLHGEKNMTKNNPRYKNGSLRRKHRARFKAMGLPCHICGGRLGPIHYDEPSNAEHPLSFVIDEIKPVSRYKEFGYNSPEEAAQDWNNLAPAHYICNLNKSNHTMSELRRGKIKHQRDICSNGW